jgi:predicted AlkP superfamily phosphohydrolase/phosphomutase
VTADRRVLAISLDAADADLVLAWARAGELPVLGRLLREGARARLRSLGDVFPESVWGAVNTGTPLGHHGIYNWRYLRPGGYALAWAPNGRDAPFWSALRADQRALLVDVPYTAPLRDDRIVELVGWGQRGASLRASWPPELIDEVHERHGRYPDWLNMHFRRSERGDRRLLRALERMVDVRTRVVTELMRERPWSLCLACWWELHSAGHAFQRDVDPASWGHEPDRARRMGDALLRVYRAADRAVGELIDAAGPGCDVVVFSGMGLARNVAGEEALPRMLIRLGYQVPATPPARARPLHALRQSLPWSIRYRLHLRLSQEARERTMERMWLEGTDWERTRAFAEPGHGWVRLNVRGRQPRGIVAPGREYRELCDEIAAELLALEDADTGAPAVERVVHRDEFVCGPRAEEVPDLLVRWSSGGLLRALRHPRAGVVDENLADTPYTEHSGTGFALAAGPHVRAGASAEGEVVDLAPTLLALLGVSAPPSMTGTPLSGLLAGAASPPPRR